MAGQFLSRVADYSSGIKLLWIVVELEGHTEQAVRASQKNGSNSLLQHRATSRSIASPHEKLIWDLRGLNGTTSFWQ